VSALRCGNQDIGAVKLLHCWLRVQGLYEVLWHRIAGSPVIAWQLARDGYLQSFASMKCPPSRQPAQRTSVRRQHKM